MYLNAIVFIKETKSKKIGEIKLILTRFVYWLNYKHYFILFQKSMKHRETSH